MKGEIEMTIKNTKTTIINLNDEQNRVILVVFLPDDESDVNTPEAEVYTTYRDYGVINYQFSIPYEVGKENLTTDMVIRNLESGNLAWGELIR